MYFIYKNFELQGVLASFSTLKWERNYSNVGSFELEMLFDVESFVLLNINNYIYKKDTKETCIITERYVRTNSLGEVLLTVKGKSLSCFLSYRIFSFTGDINLYDFIDRLIKENFTTPLNENRKIENFRLKPLPNSLKNVQLSSLEYKDQEVLKAISEQLELNGYGFRINYLFKEKAFEFQVYQGVRSSAIFSFEFNNISEQEYYENFTDEKNVNLDDMGNYRNDIVRALERKEVNGEITHPTIDMEFVIIENSIQYKYLKNWDLGDIVTAKNEILDIELNKNIREVEEFTDNSGTYITVKFK